MNRRSLLLLGFGAALAAPAVVRAESLMKIAVLRETLTEASLLRVMTDADILKVLDRELRDAFGYRYTGTWAAYKAGEALRVGQPVRLDGDVAWAV